jgi:hypothetical protein
MELSHISMVEAEVTSVMMASTRWRRSRVVIKMAASKWQRQDGGPRMWVKPEVNASTVDDEMTRNRARRSHLVRVNRLGCAPSGPAGGDGLGPGRSTRFAVNFADLYTGP